MFNTEFKVNKVFVTNLLASSLVFIGFFLEGDIKSVVLDAGFFALSGSITNWLAIYMLFDRVPGFYGSGVIPLRFEEFKISRDKGFGPPSVRRADRVPTPTI